MIAIITSVYAVAVWVLFSKLKLIKTTAWSIGAAVVIGVLLIGAIVIAWQFAAPQSTQLVVSRYVVPIVPQVKGPVAKIHAEPNVPLKKGEDILFEIQKVTYQNTVDQVTGSLQAAEKNVAQSDAGIRAAAAAIKKAEANLAATKAELDVAIETEKLNPVAISKLKVTQLKEEFNASTAAVEQARAGDEQARAGLESAQKTVTSVQAQLANAQFDLDQCVVYAPADGFVTNWQIREGTMAVSLPLAPVGTFVDTSQTFLVASFPQNVLKNARAGDAAEITLKTRPGEVFQGTVDTIVEATGEGQFATSGQLVSAADIGSSGMLVVRFRLEDEAVANDLAIGTAGTAVIYTDFGKPFHVISKIVTRMNALMYYLIPY